MTLLSAAQTLPLTYPQARRSDQVDDYHGTKVADPYRWLEDTDSAETHAWVEAENKLTFGYLDQLPYRQAIRDRLTKLWNYERFSTPSQHGGRYFFQHNTGLQQQNVLFVAESLNAEPRVLLDPNTLSPDGTVALAGEAISD
ncbi:MAG: S9 family peptidase, partial [Candidatus Sulfotelmatobacter sp.]